MKDRLLTSIRIFWFWIPLAAMWLLMAVEQPIVAAVIARLPEAELNLAIFGLTYFLAIIIESPVIMLLTAGTALARSKDSYDRLLRFTHIFAVGLSVLHLVIGVTPLYGYIVGDLIGVPAEVVEPSRFTFLLMIPWTAAIAYRRLWQGVLIRFHRTKVVPLTMLARLLGSCVVLGIGLTSGRFRGADLGAISLSVGVVAAAITAYWFVRPTVRRHLSQPSPNDEPLPWKGLLEFYLPLALTPLIYMLGRPILLAGLARAAEPLKSLAVWPVVMGALFIGRSFSLSFQEVVVALIDDRASFETLRRFTVGLALVLSGCFALVAVTPIARALFSHLAGLSQELVALAIMPTMILSLVPGLDALVSWRQGLLVHVKQTRTITGGVVINVLLLTAVMFCAGVLLPRTPGTIIAAIALTAAMAAQWGFLIGFGRKTISGYRGTPDVLVSVESLTERRDVSGD